MLNLVLPSVGSWVQGEYVSGALQATYYVIGGYSLAALGVNEFGDPAPGFFSA